MFSRLLLVCLPLALTACGYGWQDAPRDYPPSSSRPAQAGSSSIGARTPLAADEYIVQPGDTLYSIGFKNQLDYHDLAAWNGIGADYLIRPGRLLRLAPPPGQAVAAHIEGVQTQALGAGSAPLPAVTTPQAISAPTPLMIPAAPALPQPTTPAPTALPAQAPMSIPSGIASTPAPAAPGTPLSIPAAGATPATTVAMASRPVASASGFRWPTLGTVIGHFAPAVGAKGIDIAGELGQPVTAAAAGKVVYSGSALKGYGELVILKHDETTLTAYAHNRRRLVKEGDTVAAGETIAELGIGPEQQPILHFEVREHGKPVDPMRYLPGR